MKRADEEPAFFNIENPYYDSCATDALMLFNLRRERITLYLHGHLRVLRVHRLYLAQAIRTPEYAVRHCDQKLCSDMYRLWQKIRAEH